MTDQTTAEPKGYFWVRKQLKVILRRNGTAWFVAKWHAWQLASAYMNADTATQLEVDAEIRRDLTEIGAA